MTEWARPALHASSIGPPLHRGVRPARQVGGSVSCGSVWFIKAGSSLLPDKPIDARTWLRNRHVVRPDRLAETAVQAAERQHTSPPGEKLASELVRTAGKGGDGAQPAGRIRFLHPRGCLE